MKVLVEGRRGVIGSILDKWLNGGGQRAKGMEVVDGGPDVAVLCLPPEQAKERAKAYSEDTVVVDASNAHRQVSGWVYGMVYWRDHAEKIMSANRIAAPGCYATGAVLMLRPLAYHLNRCSVDKNYFSIHGISGYSGGGQELIREFEGGGERRSYVYATHMEHPQSYEIEKYAELKFRPMFVPSVGHFRSGMIVSAGLNLHAEAVLDIWESWYGGSDKVHVLRECPETVHVTGGRIELYAAAHSDWNCMGFAASNNAITSAGTLMDILVLLKQERFG